jgi:hypothetical protein
MTLLTLVRYLFTGSSDAIRAVAASRGAAWVGLAFVLSAGLARDYDGEYLPARPWVLAVPFAAAVGMATILFVPVYVGMRPTRPGQGWPRVGRTYGAFVGLFLLTAPLAWLYAIPYERFLSPAAATAANLWTLALVALWRVGLMARVLDVMTGRGFVPCLCAVMLVADILALVALAYAPVPVLDFMGGLRLSDRERVVANAAMLVRAGAFLTLVIWFFGTVNWLFFAEGSALRVDELERRRVVRGVVGLAVASVLVWAAILPVTQPELRLRHEVEAHLAAGRFAEALAEMSRHEQREFPPQWDPPPHLALAWGRVDDLLWVMEALFDEPRKPWVEKVYAGKLARLIDSPTVFWFPQDGAEARTERVRRLLERMPHGQPWDGIGARLREALGLANQARDEADGPTPAGKPAR